MSTSTSSALTGNRPPGAAVPPLEPGDRLTRAEFELRYEAMPTQKKAELIEGVVYMPSPVRLDRHATPHADLVTWLGHYRAKTPGVRVGDNATIRLDLDNEPQPDAVLFIAPEYGGQVRISPDDYLDSAPELVVEVASSSASYDLNAKRHVYRRHGVLEYVVWRVLDREIDWFTLCEGRYERLEPDGRGVLCSQIFPGLWLDTAALLRGDLAEVLQRLHEGMSTTEYAALVEQLRQRGAGR